MRNIYLKNEKFPEKSINGGHFQKISKNTKTPSQLLKIFRDITNYINYLLFKFQFCNQRETFI